MSARRGSGLLVVTMDVPPEHEAELNRWYDEEHLPERASLPGFLSARRFVAREGPSKYLAVYELESADALESDAYRALCSPTPGTLRIRGLRTSYLRNVYEEITPARLRAEG